MVVPLLLGALAGEGARAESSRCKLLLHFALKGPRTVHVLGAARPDTVLAGGGPVQYTTGDGHFGPGTDRPIYGQVVAIDRIGTSATASLPPGVSSVVIVPWDYSAKCRPTPWTAGARWLPVGERGLVVGVLREPRFWTGGIPTLDVHVTDVQPYPQKRDRSPVATDSLLTVDELFTLLETVPDEDRLDSAPLEAVTPVQDWVRANPAVARRWPATEVVGMLHLMVEEALLENIVPPVAGTYRFAVARPGRDSAVFFARTYSNATMQWNPRKRPTVWLADMQAPETYTVLIATAASEGELPVRDEPRVIYMGREGSLGLYRDARERPDGSREWPGRIDIFEIERALLADFQTSGRGDQSASQGLFVMDPQGRVRVELTIGQSDGRPVVVRGERISTTTAVFK